MWWFGSCSNYLWHLHGHRGQWPVVRQISPRVRSITQEVVDQVQIVVEETSWRFPGSGTTYGINLGPLQRICQGCTHWKPVLLRSFRFWEELRFWCLPSFLSVLPSRFVVTQLKPRIIARNSICFLYTVVRKIKLSGLFLPCSFVMTASMSAEGSQAQRVSIVRWAVPWCGITG